ncbi:MAG: M15 family metallopeptidase [Clostridia bacterium]|nr:M15 family metallopeptidase [Clostridia bacterium]
MKLKKLLVVLLAIYLTGCWSDGVVLENDISENTQTEQPLASEAALNEGGSSTKAVEQPDINDEDFVKVKDYIPDIVVDLRYATANNFTKQKIYDFTDAWLRYGTVKKLSLVQEELQQKGMSIKIWDGFRPTSAQFKLWDVCPNSTYVANPNNGFSSHSRGNTVDITVVGANGKEIVMPTGFDDFSKLADRDYSDCSNEAASNALMLEKLMKKHGFIPYSGEWWHFADEQTYPVDKVFEPID